MGDHVQTVVIGGGQAGLATSYWLTHHGREHIVLEQATQAANAWRNDRWDSFTLVTPNWATRMPGMESPSDNPHGFMPRDELVAFFEQYIERFRLPVRYNVRVTSVEPDGAGYVVKADHSTMRRAAIAARTFLNGRTCQAFSTARRTCLRPRRASPAIRTFLARTVGTQSTCTNSRDGVKLLGHMTNAAGHAIALAPDLQENLAKPVLCRVAVAPHSEIRAAHRHWRGHGPHRGAYRSKALSGVI